MKILIDIGHPADVHQFANFAKMMTQGGHQILFTTREKEFEIKLLTHYGLTFKTFGVKYSTWLGKFFGLLKFSFLEIIISAKFKPDIYLSHGSIAAAIASFVFGKPHISFEDTFNFEQVRLYLPFTNVVLTSDYQHPLNSTKVIKYRGYHELMYLHPNHFTKKEINEYFPEIKGNYIIVRFVAWNATHDFGHKGISSVNKIKAVRCFEKYGQVLISAECELPNEIEKNRILYPPETIHHLISNASLVFGESATMVAEAAVLGVPGIYIDSTGRFYTNELETKYGLVYNFTESEIDQQKAIIKGEEILASEGIKNLWVKRQSSMLSDKIDVTSFLVWFVENYPESFKIMKRNPDYQQRFQ